VAFQIEVSFWAQMVSALQEAVGIGRVEMNLVLWVCSVFLDHLRCQFVMEGICPCGFDEVWPGVRLLQHSACDAQ